MREEEKIALAGFLHDIGKFGQRAEIEIGNIDWQNFCPTDENNNPTHKHAAYTKKILSDLILKNLIKINNNEEKNKFLNLAVKHHIPENENEWIVAVADRLANGFKKETFEKYNKMKESQNFEIQLDHLFKKDKFKLDVLSPDNIFPTKEKGKNYYKLWKEFENDIKLINNKLSNFPENIKIDALEYLLKKYTIFIPHTNFPDLENISLYEHLKTTSIFASAIASMSKENQNKIISYYKDGKDTLNEKLFLLIAGDFFGIQNFIFNEVQTKFAAKILRAKSAFIQILVKVLAFYICEKLEISKYSIISTHAGKFEILVPNEEKIIKKLKEIQNDFNEYFIENFFGETGVGITWIEASMEDFLVKDKYKKLRKNLADKVEEIKYKKFDLINIGGYKIFKIDKDLSNENLCDFCHKRKDKYENKKEYKICNFCEKYVKIGQALVKNTFLAISKNRKSEEDIEIFRGYYLHFFENPSKNEAKNDIAIYDIKTDTKFRGFKKWELSSYVATKEIFNVIGEKYKNYIENETQEPVENILTLDQLACLSVKNGINGTREFGVEAIMALKGDGDGMGNFIKKSDITDSFAKYNFFAKMIDYYFSVYVPIKFMQNKALYTVFAGGDDIFVLGAWDEVIELAKNIRDDFVKFTNANLTFSAGLIISKANKPINFLALKTEEALEEAKDFCCEIEKNRCKEICENKENICTDENNNIRKKDAVNIFNQTVRWKNFKRIRNCTLNKFLEYEEKYKKELPTTFLYKLIELATIQLSITSGFAHGQTVSIVIHTASGGQYPATVTLP
jgi:CRISPR-associated protein Csm1